MKFLNYRGTRIRPYHLNLYRHYLFGMWFPALLVSGAYGYFVLYPLVSEIFEKQTIDYAALLLPVGELFLLLLLPLFICLWGRRRSFLKGGFFYRAYQRQMLARMLKSNGLYDKKERTSNQRTTEKMIFPKVYYRNTKEILYLTVPTDGMKWHDRFEKIAKTFEEMYIADFINVQKEMGFTTYSLMIDVISKRINISDCVVTNGQVKLMDGVVWDYAEVPHMLITGGTGGGKTYLILTLIQALVKVGTVDICDPKEADLKDLQDLKLFKGHVFTGTKWITRCLKNAVAEMNRRYVYMKLLPTYTTGKNFAYYDIPPYFIIVDEWAAFFGTLNYKEQDEILGYV
uniref:FtsK/SpoIIIE domain-containing protein n=1 Tax=Enterococcus faecalis TaxID=1351 RepID=UPI0021C71474